MEGAAGGWDRNCNGLSRVAWEGTAAAPALLGWCIIIYYMLVCCSFQLFPHIEVEALAFACCWSNNWLYSCMYLKWFIKYCVGAPCRRYAHNNKFARRLELRNGR